MVELIAVGMVLGFLCLVGWRAEPHVKALLTLKEREVALRERDVERPAPGPVEPIPTDLLAETLAESEPWAREQAQKALREMYSELGSWDQVRIVRTIRGN